MPFVDSSSQLEPLLFQMKQYKNLTKSTIEILPSSGQTAYGPGSKLTFTLPYASLISLEDLALHFDFEGIAPQHTDGTDVVRVIAPKDVASLIAEVDIRVNGQTIQHLTSYGDIVNLLNIFEDAKTAKKVLQGCDVNVMKKKTFPDNGTFGNANDRELAPATQDNNKHKYVINHWYGLLGARGKEVSSNFIDTNMLGEMTISFVFAKGNVCFFGESTEASVKASTVPANAITSAQIATAKTNPTRGSFNINNPKMSMVRYNLPQSYSEALRSNLSSGAKYQIAFNHYEIHSQEAGKSDGSIRWNENSRDIKGLIAYFTSSTRDNTTIASTYDDAVKTSKYFKYDNPIHKSSHFQIGSVLMPQNALDSTDCFLDLTRAVAGVRGNNTEFYSEIKTVEDFVSSYFMNYLSLEMSEGMTMEANAGKKLLSGLSSEQLPISCSYKYTNNGTSTYAWAKNVNVMSLTTRLLVIENGQNCYVEI